jgi:hypothetical protein
MLSHRYLHHAVPLIAGAVALLLIAGAAESRVTKIVISQTISPAFNGQSFGTVGQYEMLRGTASGELDPADRRNAVITDINLAPRNANGKVEYTATFTLLKPIDMSKASGVMTYDVVNRGNHVIGRLNVGGDPGDGFLYAQGDVFLWSGWQGDILPETVPAGSLVESVRVPVAINADGSSVTGPVTTRFVNVQGNVNTQQLARSAGGPAGNSADLSPTLGGAGRTPMSLNTALASLISATSETQSGVLGGVTTIPSTDFAFADCRTVPFPGTPDPTRLCLRNGFNPALLYRLVYTAKDPLVLGVGMAAMRDVSSFFRRELRDDAGTSNPIAGRINFALGYGVSQSGRYIKTFLNLGLNEDEQGRIVWDGADTDIPGALGQFNVRFGQPGNIANIYEPGAEAPLWWGTYNDVVRGRGMTSLLTRCNATGTCPKIFETYGGPEYWYGRGTVGIAGTTGVDDIAVPSNVRRYYQVGTTHGGGPGGFSIAPPASPGCDLLSNPNSEVEPLRALYVALKAWVVSNVPPPPSAYPRVTDGTLVPANALAMGWPTIPGSPKPDGVMNSLLDYDYGPLFNFNDNSGIISNVPIPVKQVIPTLAPKVDADGNELAGIKSVLLQAPLGTYTGWNPVSSGVLKGQECVLTGGFIPFAKTKGERLANGDSRPSIAERYGTVGNYQFAAATAAKKLMAQRLLLPQDANRLVAQALQQMSASGLLPTAPFQVGSMGPVPKAQCGPSDRTESGLQGQTTTQERASGDSQRGYNCNLELVGQFRGEGAFSQDGPAYFGHCAYMATENDPRQAHPGIVVIDVSDPKNPRATDYLDDTSAGLNPHENLKVNQARGLLGLAQSNGPNFAVYDLNADCAHPILASSITVPNGAGHMGGWAEDGKTYYIGQQFRGVNGILPIIDVSDPYNAKWLLNWTFTGDGRPHDVNTSIDGTRLYAGQPGNFGAPPNNSSFGPDGLVILDVSDIQFRRANPQIRIVSKLFWDDQGQAEQMLLFFSKGRTFLISTDESGGQAGVGGLAAACTRGASAYGYSNVIDITDETNPRIASKIMLEVHDPSNCQKFLNEPPEVGGGALDYSTERCAVDRTTNPTMAACGSRGTGTRVYDIRDPLHPAEIAYWKGPAPRTAFLPGSGSWGPGIDRTVEKQAGFARFVKVPAANGNGLELNLWIVGDAGGFQVLRFTDAFLQTNVGKAINADALQGN